jgi:hypothetical protein
LPFLGISSKEGISLKRRSLLKQIKCWKALSLESKYRSAEMRSRETRQTNCESYKKSLIAKSSQNDAKKKE